MLFVFTTIGETIKASLAAMAASVNMKSTKYTISIQTLQPIDQASAHPELQPTLALFIHSNLALTCSRMQVWLERRYLPLQHPLQLEPLHVRQSPGTDLQTMLTYARCTRSVAMVPVAYNAHLVVQRAVFRTKGVNWSETHTLERIDWADYLCVCQPAASKGYAGQSMKLAMMRKGIYMAESWPLFVFFFFASASQVDHVSLTSNHLPPLLHCNTTPSTSLPHHP